MALSFINASSRAGACVYSQRESRKHPYPVLGSQKQNTGGTFPTELLRAVSSAWLFSFTWSDWGNSSCGEQRRARVSDTLKQCVLLMRAGLEDTVTSGQWENGKDSVISLPAWGGFSEAQGDVNKAFFWSECEYWQWVQLCRRHIYGLKTAPLQTLLLVRLAKPASLIREYIINLDSLFTWI